MNKLNRNIRKIILIVMLLILSTTITYKVDALTMNYTILSTSTNPYYYCSEHGAPLPAANTANTYYQNGGAPDDVGATGSVLEENIANGLANLADGENIVSESIYSALGGTEYTQAELSEFTCVGDSYANAIETYILLNGDGYYGYVNTGSKWQELWWGTPAGQGYVHTTNGTQEVNINPIEDSINGMAVKGFNDNENKGILAKGSIIDEFKNMKTDVKAIEISGTSTRFAANEANSDEATQTSENENKSETNRANAFATYIEAVTGKDNAICGKDGFDIKYKPEWVTGKVAEDSTNSDKQIDYDNPTIAVDGNKFIVGPFAIDYIHAYVGDEVFSEITKMELVLGKADGTEEILVIGGTEDNSDKFTLSKQSSGVFPEGKETFYLVFDNIENVTQIKDLKVSFRYLNAKGKYELWDGTYTVKNTTVEPSTETDDEGNVTYKLTVSTSTTVKNAQTVSKKSSSDTTEKWYETVQLNRDIDKNRGEISIKKVITDIDGKEIDYSTLGDGEKEHSTLD